MFLDDFWSFSGYGVDCHLLLARVRLDGSLLLNDGEAAWALEDVENLVFGVAYVLVKVFGYLCEAVHVHVDFAQDS